MQECFTENLGTGGGLLHRDKLERVKAHHLPHMNVQQFEHIKVSRAEHPDNRIREGRSQRVCVLCVGLCMNPRV